MKKLRSGLKHLAPLHEMIHSRPFPLPLFSRHASLDLTITAHSPMKISFPGLPFPPLQSGHSRSHRLFIPL